MLLVVINEENVKLTKINIWTIDDKHEPINKTRNVILGEAK